MTIEMLEKKYPTGTHVKYTGEYPIYGVGIIQVEKGDIGTVIGVNCNGDLRVSWENGSFVSLTPGQHHFSVLYTH